MSSHEFSAELIPDQTLRNVVVLSGVIATLVGVVLILQMPVNPIFRLAMTMLWLAYNKYELCDVTRRSANVARIEINQHGKLWVTDPAGQRRPAELLRGSVVLARYAWIRIRFEDGRKYGELMSGNAVENKQWHRFQLIWKQARQIIGRAE